MSCGHSSAVVVRLDRRVVEPFAGPPLRGMIRSVRRLAIRTVTTELSRSSLDGRHPAMVGPAAHAIGGGRWDVRPLGPA